MDNAAATQTRHALAAHEVLSGFTSLGDNCEFGLVQRRAGVEQLGLLRFSFSRIDQLIASLKDGFADLDPVEVLSIEQPWNDEYISCFGVRGFFHHTFLRTGSIDPAKLRQQEVARITFLRRRLIEDLHGGERIFVRKSNEHAPAQMHALYQSLQAYGHNTLLWVELADGAHPAGSVERVEGGLLRGYVDRFAPYGDATAVSFACWLGVCATAYEMVRGPLPLATTHFAILYAGGAAQPVAHNAVSVARSNDVPPLRPGASVFRHFAADAVNNVAVLSPPEKGLAPGQIHTASIWLWLPTAFRGKLIAPVLTHATRPFVQPAILPDRDCWQQIWVSGLVPEDKAVQAGIWADLAAGDVFYTTHWTIEKAAYPSCYFLA